jgi:hypothetical protein
MIEGLKYHFKSSELADHMRGRAEYHDKRAGEKEAALPDMKAALEKIKAHSPAKNVQHMSKVSNSYHVGDPDEDLEADIRDHKNKAMVFRTLADHVVPSETYVLTESDLRRLEILRDA